MFNALNQVHTSQTPLDSLFPSESVLLALNSRNHLPGMPAGAELQEPDALPGAGGQSAVGNGDVDGRADERGLDVGLRALD